SLVVMPKLSLPTMAKQWRSAPLPVGVAAEMLLAIGLLVGVAVGLLLVTRNAAEDILAESIDIASSKLRRRFHRRPFAPLIPCRDQLPLGVARHHLLKVRGERADIAGKPDRFADLPKARRHDGGEGALHIVRDCRRVLMPGIGLVAAVPIAREHL